MDRESSVALAQSVIRQLLRSGHFLHYRMGGRTGRRRILLHLLECDGILQRNLQEQLGVQSASLSEMIIKMEAEGLVEKLRSAADGRNLVLRLTPAGAAEAEREKALHDANVAGLMSCFTDAELKELNGLLARMLDHWRETEGDLAAPPSGTDSQRKQNTRQS